MQHGAPQYVGFWARFGATLVDSVLLVAVTVPMLVAAYGWAYFDPNQTGFVAGPLDVLISWVFPAAAVLLFWRYQQATPGKRLFAARIVDAATGGPLTTKQAIGRYLAYFVSTVPLCLGFLWVAFDPKKQGWHDKLAGTVVVKGPRGPGDNASLVE